jgi:enoyl-CoA hydratase
MYKTLLTTLENQIFTITINRPDKLNALNKVVMQELEAAVQEVYENPGIRSALITGSGTKAFVAGADIAEFAGLSVSEGKVLAKKGQDIFSGIENCPKPVIACINGFALGGGCELAMSCHFRIAAEHARFGQPEVSLGLIPGYGGTQRLTQLIGRGRALELLLSGNMIDAPTALQYGLINHIYPGEELLDRAKALLTVINRKAAFSLGGCIRAANAVFDDSKNGYDTELREFSACFGTADMQEGIRAFLEKRPPDFKGI